MVTSLFTDKIVSDPEIVGGQPHILGTRFTVKQIVVWHEYMSMGVDEIAHLYGREPSTVYVALAYYFDNQKVIRDAIRDEALLVEQLKNQFPSKLSRAYA